MSREAKEKKNQCRRERNFREKRATKASLTPKSSPDDLPPGGIIHLSYDITWEPLEKDEPKVQALRDEFGDEQWSQLHSQLYDDPRKAVPVLEALLKRYPDVPSLYNWLGVAYQATGENAKAGALTRLNFERNPDYLFARVAMCEMLLRDGGVDEVTRILDKNFDLKFMYPCRNVFHITEVLGFEYLLVKYFLALGNTRQARIQLNFLEKIAPQHPVTKDARLLIARAFFKFPNFVSRWLK
ncbi:MAG TPA: tetratricopeptide repeat protein [Humisphaera sp.]|nr:tetratricopeptide repeat protein [Humisphaera sp.]